MTKTTAPCGHLDATFNERDQLFAKGQIRTLDLQLALRLAPIPEAERGTSDKAPSHHVEAVVASGPVRIGVAWAKRMERGDQAGKVMVSMSLTDPSLPWWANNLTAFPRGGDGRMEIVYERTRQPLPSGEEIAGNQAAMDQAAGTA